MDLRKLEERFFQALMGGAFALVAAAILSIVGTVAAKGIGALSWEMVATTPGSGYYLGGPGGIANAIAGSLALALGATGGALLLGLPVALHLNVYLPRGSRLGRLVRFVLDVAWGTPSIIYGALGYLAMTALGVPPCLLAGTITVALLVFPITVRAMDEVLQAVPGELVESAYAIGSTRLETALHVMLRHSLPGLVTAVLLAFGRALGDAAAVLLTAGFSDSLPYSLLKPAGTLPLAIFFQLGTPFPEAHQRGFAAALVLTALVLASSIAARAIQQRMERLKGRTT